MARSEELFGTSPMHTCSPVTFSGGPTAEEIRLCRERSPWLHQVITKEDIAVIVAAGKDGWIQPWLRR